MPLSPPPVSRPTATRRLPGLVVTVGWVLLGGPLAPPAGAAVRAGGAAADVGWTAPLQPRPVLVAPFAAPAGPYAPGHRGVDLRGGGPGATVLAAGAGVVAFAGRVAGRGVVSIDHPGGLRTTYEPVAAVVRRGERVAAGRPIGLLEGTGGHCPPAACLHWGLRQGATYLDPMTLLAAQPVRLLPVWTPGGPAGSQPAGPRDPATTGSSSGADGDTGRGDAAPGGSRPLVPLGVVAATGLGATALLRRRAPP